MKYVLATVTMLVIALPLWAQNYPEKPVKIVTNMPVGSAPDTVLRKLASKLKDQWKVPVMVDNRPGASGAVAMEHYVQNEKRDGYTLYYGDLANFVSMPLLFNKTSLLGEIKPLVPIYRNWFAVIAPAGNNTPLKSSILAKPFYGSWAVGSPGHICGAELADRLQINATHIPYKEYSAWYLDMISGQTSYGCSSVGSVLQYVNSGKIKLVAIASPQRDPTMPNLPTVKELYGFDLGTPYGWLAMFIHKEVDDRVSKKLYNDINAALSSPEIQDAIAFSYGMPFNMNIKEFRTLWQNDIQVHKRLLDKYNISVK